MGAKQLRFKADIFSWAIGYISCVSLWASLLVAVVLSVLLTWGGIGIMLLFRFYDIELNSPSDTLNFVVGVFAPAVLSIEAQSKLIPILQIKGTIAGSATTIEIARARENSRPLSDIELTAYMQWRQAVMQLSYINEETLSVNLASTIVFWVVVVCHLFGQVCWSFIYLVSTLFLGPATNPRRTAMENIFQSLDGFIRSFLHRLHHPGPPS